MLCTTNKVVWDIGMVCVFKTLSNVYCLSPLPRLDRLLWCDASRSWAFEKRLLIFLCSLYRHNLPDGPLVCASVSIWNTSFISFFYLWFSTIFVDVSCLFSPVPADSMFLLQHWLPGDGPCKPAMWAFFTSLLLPSSPDLFQWLTAGLPLLAIKLSQVHRCNGCSVCESIFHISCFWGLRKKKILCSNRKGVLLIWQGISTVEENQCESCWELRSKRKRKLLVRKAEIKIRANKTF